MGRIDGDGNRSVALYWDFENLHAGLVEARSGEGFYSRNDVRFKPQEPLVDVQAVVELAASFGPVAINRAYCNWQFFSRYRDALLQGGVDLIQLFPPGASAKNGADIRLCLDATEDMGRFTHLGTIVIVGGDSDFMPVAQKIKAAGRTLVGVGTRKNTNRHWAKSCHQFRYYESLADATGGDPQQPPATPAQLLQRAVQLLADTRGEPWIDREAVWQMVQRLDPTFDIRDHGYAGFAEMVQALDAVVEQRPAEAGPQLRLR